MPTVNELVYQLSGKLLLRQEIPLDDVALERLCMKGFISPTSSITKHRFSFFCQRCGNKKKSLFASMPCLDCETSHIYCRKCIEMGRVIECEPLYEWTGPAPLWKKIAEPLTWEGELTLRQQHAAQEMVKVLTKEKHKEILVWAVCGAGKTEMLFPAIETSLRLGKRICIATPRADVVRELLPRLKEAFQSVEVQGLYGGAPHKSATSQLIIATTHQLLRFKSAFDVMIIDEIDAFPFHADPSLPFATDRAKQTGASTIYLTATPRKIHRQRISRGQLHHVFVPVRFHGHPLPVPQLKMCFDLKRKLSQFKPPNAFLSWLHKRQQKTRQLLIFVPTIQMAVKMKKQLSSFIKEQDLFKPLKTIQHVHAEDPERENKITLFRQRQIDILITTTILERGVTFPSVDVAIIHAGHDVFDEAALVQISGRAGRSADDPTGEVIFFHDGRTNAMMHAIRAITKMNKRAGF